MARVLFIGGGCRGRYLAATLAGEGHAVRMTTRTEAGRSAIQAAGAECFVGSPDRIGSLRYALEGVSVLCWLLGTATGDAGGVAALHGPRLDALLSQIIDTTVRGIVYEAAGTVDAATLAAGAGLVSAKAERNSIPYQLLDVDPADGADWQRMAQAAVGDLLSGYRPGSGERP